MFAISLPSFSLSQRPDWGDNSPNLWYPHFDFPPHTQLSGGHRPYPVRYIQYFGRQLLIGILSLIFGIVVMIFPRILNYLVGVYLIIVGLITIFRHRVLPMISLITGIIILVFGIIIMIFPAIINILIGIAFIIQGVIAIGHYFGWF